jgi:NADPH:quinone reductase-like Zn-dependent oxidoreductase
VGRGVDLVLDIMGGSYVARNLAALATDALALVQIGLRAGEPAATVDLRRVMARRSTITGPLRPRSVEEKGQIAAAVLREVCARRGAAGAAAAGGDVSATGAAAAHALMESSAHVGKIVLVP